MRTSKPESERTLPTAPKMTKDIAQRVPRFGARASSSLSAMFRCMGRVQSKKRVVRFDADFIVHLKSAYAVPKIVKERITITVSIFANSKALAFVYRRTMKAIAFHKNARA